MKLFVISLFILSFNFISAQTDNSKKKTTYKKALGSSKARGTGVICPFDCTIIKRAKFFPNESGQTDIYINTVEISALTGIDNVVLKLMFYSVDENGYPDKPLLKENVEFKIEKTKQRSKIDVSALHIKMPENGVIIALEDLLTEHNKWRTEGEKHPDAFTYEPGFSTYKTKQENSDSMYFDSKIGEWERHTWSHYDYSIAIRISN